MKYFFILFLSLITLNIFAQGSVKPEAFAVSIVKKSGLLNPNGSLSLPGYPAGNYTFERLNLTNSNYVSAFATNGVLAGITTDSLYAPKFQAGQKTATTSATGKAVIPIGRTMSDTLYAPFVIIKGDSTYRTSIVSRGTTSFTVRVTKTSGSALGATALTFLYQLINY